MCATGKAFSVEEGDCGHQVFVGNLEINEYFLLGCRVFIFVSEILNRIVNNVDNFYDDRLYMCEAINSNVTKAVSLVQEDVIYFVQVISTNCALKAK